MKQLLFSTVLLAVATGDASGFSMKKLAVIKGYAIPGPFSPDGSRFARVVKIHGTTTETGEGSGRQQIDSQIEVYDTRSGALQNIIKLPSRQHGWDVNGVSPFAGYFDALAFTPDGRKIIGFEGAIADYTPTSLKDRSKLLMWDIQSERIEAELSDIRNCVPTRSSFQPYQCVGVEVSFSPDGTKAALGVHSWWDHENKELLLPASSLLVDLSKGSKARFPGVLFYRGNKLLRYLDSSTHCELRDHESDKRIVLFAGCTARRRPKPTLSPDGRWLVGSAVWDAATGIERFDYSTDYLPAFAPNGRFVRFAKKEVIVTDPVTGATTASYSDPAWADNDWLSISRDGSFAVMSSSSGMMLYELTWTESQRNLPAAAAAPVPSSIDVDSYPQASSPRQENAFAVIVGVERYRQSGLPAAEHAARDAKTMHAYLTGAMGFDSKNVALLTDDQATRADLEKYLGPWLANRVDKDSRVFVYFSGHGAPNPRTGEGFLMPYEGDPSYPEVTAVSVKQVYQALGKLPTKNVTAVLDACFSGQGERSLIAKGTRPLVNVAAPKAPAGLVVLSAATGGQVSVSSPESRHGLLTHHILEGLHGKADADGDKAVTTAELYRYVRPAVERAARRQNQEQTPTLMPAPEALGADGGGTWIRLK